MAYIYKIENLVNGKVYIGKTLSTPEQRWREHVHDSRNSDYSNRPLYKAFHKYGIDNFQLSTVEICQESQVNEREIYWIEYYGSFKNGYNATIGGDGKRYCDYDLIFALYQEGKNLKEIAEITHYDVATCRHALENFNITHEQRVQRGREKITKVVFQLDAKSEEIIAVYPSIQKAYDALGKQHSGHIAAVCAGKRKTAYGYKWKYQKD